MSRRRNKPKRLGKRPTTRAGRQPSIGPTLERLYKMQELVGYSLSGRDTDASCPLMVLCVRGIITEAQSSAGQDYARMYWRCFPQFFAKTSSLGAMPGRGSISLPSEITEAQEIERETLFKKIDNRLHALPRNVRRQVHIVTCDFDLPDWFARSIDNNMTDSDYQNRRDMLAGLSLLAS